MSEETPEPTTAAPASGRYQRSMAGMVGAMIVTVAVILAFVLFRAINRDSPEIRPEPVDYLPVVEGLQKSGADTGMDVLYPATLPQGWIATARAFDPGQLWSLSLLTDEEHYVGIRQGPGQVNDFVEEYVDENAEAGKTITLDAVDGGTEKWDTYTDDNGDYAVVRSQPLEVEGSEGNASTGIEIVILVVGTASEDQVNRIASELTTAPVPDSAD